MENWKYNKYAPLVLRLVLGLVFIIPGLQKLTNPSMIIGMLQGLGFPVPTLMGWILLLSEIVFGTLLLIGWKLNYTIWPLITVLGIATATVHIPAWLNAQPMALITLLMHVLGMATLISIFLSGPGPFALKRIKVVFNDSIQDTPVTKTTLIDPIIFSDKKAVPEPEQE